MTWRVCSGGGFGGSAVTEKGGTHRMLKVIAEVSAAEEKRLPRSDDVNTMMARREEGGPRLGLDVQESCGECWQAE